MREPNSAEIRAAKHTHTETALLCIEIPALFERLPYRLKNLYGRCLGWSL